MVCSHLFRKFVNMMGTLCAERARRQFANFRKWWLHCGHHFRKFQFVYGHHFQKFMNTQKNGPFLQPKKWFLCGIFCFPAQNLFWQVKFAKNRTRFSRFGPPSTVCNLLPHIWSHHTLLDFHTQIKSKYSTAMCWGDGGGVHFHHLNMDRSFEPIVEVWCNK